MRILFLDDAQLRHDLFAQRHGADEIVHSCTAAEAMDALDRLAPFDLVHLDHDLAESHYLELSGGEREVPAPEDPPFDPGTGMDVVRYIIAMAVERRPRAVVVHTHNPIGAEMVVLLDGAAVPAVWRKL
jgi:hypothetical protein